jgi:hypothetical protein
MPSWLRAARWAVLVVVLVTGCRDKKKSEPEPAAPSGGDAAVTASPPPVKADASGLDACIAAVASAQRLDSNKRLGELMKGCAAAQPGFARVAAASSSEERWTLLANHTDIACNQAVRKKVVSEPERGFSIALRECRPGYYGLEEKQAGWLSLDWFVIQRVGSYLAALRSVATPAQLSAMDAAIAEDRWVLPVPARLAEEYEVPVAANLIVPRDPSGWIVLTGKAVRLARPPLASLTETGAEIVDAKGAFPGMVMELDQLVSMLHDDAPAKSKQWVHRQAPVIVADKAVPSTRLLEVVAALGDTGARLAAVGRDPHRLLAVAAGFRVVPRGRLGKRLLVIEMTRDGLRVHFDTTREEVPKQGGDYDWIKLGLIIGTAKRFGIERAAIAARPWVTVDHVVQAANLLGQAGLGDVALTRLGVELVGGKKGTGTAISHATSRGPAVTGTVSSTGVSVVGVLPRKIVQRFVRRHRARVRFCYDKYLRDHPSAEGTVTVQFTIARSGGVMKVTSSGFAEPVDRCVGQVIESIRFPAPEGGTVLVRYPFSFAPSKRK